MNGSRNLHDGLTRRFADAVTAVCDGNGWVTVQHTDGTRTEAPCPACRQERLIPAVRDFLPARFRSPLGLPAAVQEWMQRGGRPSADSGKTGLLLNGPTGTGKTHTAWLAASGWLAATGTWPAETGIVFARWADLLDALRPGGENAPQRMRECKDTRLLVVDDLGAERPTPWTAERLDIIVDHRYVHSRPLIVTSNVPTPRLAARLSGELDDVPGGDGKTGIRIVSRLAEMCDVVTMTGPDRRMEAS